MAGSGVQKRQRFTAIRAARMNADGCTHREIAEALKIKPEAVKSRISLGQRLLSLEDRK